MADILIIDDEKAIRKALTEILSAEGYKTEEAGDGEEGLKKFKGVVIFTSHDHELIQTVEQCAKQTEAQQKWLTTRLKAAAPQALLVAD